MHNQLPKTLPAFIWHFLKPYKISAFVFICLGSLAGLWGPFKSILTKQIINLLPYVETETIFILFWPAFLVVIGFLLFDNITWRGMTYIGYKTEAVIKNHIIRQTMDQTLGNSHTFFQDTLSGRISNQITTLADSIELILYKITPDFLRTGTSLIASFFVAFCVNPLFFYVLLIWFITFSTFSVIMSQRLVLLTNTHAKSESILAGQLVDCIANQSTVKIFSNKAFEISRMNQFFAKTKKTFQAKELFLLLLHGGQGLMIAFMIGASTYFLIHLYGKNLVSIGDFALILSLVMDLGYAMWYTMSQVDELNQAIGKCKQSLTALMVKADIVDTPNAEKLVITQGQISFNNVKFRYKDAEILFEKQSVIIQAHQKVGLVGFSGSGKSTFVNLILRLHDVTDGAILIDNQDIRNVTQDSLHEAIAMIPQDPSLFHRSLLENIRYSRTDATDKEVIEAAKKAHAHDFILKLPQGYNTPVGERGIKLSGGQRQRIAIARAILKDAPILMLDEATSQLDSATESYIQQSMAELMQGKTTLIVAHRLSTLLHMDRILVFDQGKIIQDGTHADLVLQEGLYKKLWNTQICGFLPE